MSRLGLLTSAASSIAAIANSLALRDPAGRLAAADAAAVTDLASLGQVQAYRRVPYSPALTADYTLALADEGRALSNSSAAAAVAVTIPDNTAVAIPVGGWVDIIRHGAQALTIAPAAGVTLGWRGSYTSTNSVIPFRYQAIRLYKLASNTWYAYDLSGGGGPVTPLTLAANWVDFAGGWQTARCWVEGRTGFLTAMVKPTVALGAGDYVIATVPAGMRPLATVSTSFLLGGAGVARLDVASNGAVNLSTGAIGSGQYCALNIHWSLD